VTNEDLAPALGVSAATIAEQTGIVRRHHALEAGIGPSDLAREAALQALAAAHLAPEDLDLIVFATMTPDIAFPGSGCFLQHKLGCRTIGALDLRAQCAGFLFALATADRFIRAGRVGRVLVVGGEVYSSALDFSPRAAHVTPRFGDGAGVLILGASEQPGVLATVLHGDPTGFERFWCEFPASRHTPARMDMEHLEKGAHYYVLDPDALHRQAADALPAVAHEALARAGVAPDEVKLYVMHYLDPRVARRAAESIAPGVTGERIVATAEAAGHLGAAGIPVALADAVAGGRVGSGDLVCCAAFGAGVAWASAVIRL
jgi:3-oxoacyl-[acyl-carrier-protein] synthase-3